MGEAPIVMCRWWSAVHPFGLCGRQCWVWTVLGVFMDGVGEDGRVGVFMDGVGDGRVGVFMDSVGDGRTVY